MTEQVHYVDCLCHSFEHVVRFRLDPGWNSTEVEFRLNQILPWHKRVYVALKYIFNIDHCYHYDNVLLSDLEVEKLHKLFGSHLESLKKV